MAVGCLHQRAALQFNVEAQGREAGLPAKRASGAEG
ncbi:MAG: hypothetical protein AW07_01966 [Candidatus Accumulibacter sp. SK-11]|nr:MAG: hypothetical protein AW07_01966 [Candidatus Accumulibacter sp. SK-11]